MSGVSCLTRYAPAYLAERLPEPFEATVLLREPSLRRTQSSAVTPGQTRTPPVPESRHYVGENDRKAKSLNSRHIARQDSTPTRKQHESRDSLFDLTDFRLETFTAQCHIVSTTRNPALPLRIRA
jgi:hypothetical protein